MGALSLQHTHSICCHDCAMATYTSSSLVHILQLVASYNEVLESLSSDSSLDVSEELPESVTLSSKLYAIGINEPSLTL